MKWRRRKDKKVTVEGKRKVLAGLKVEDESSEEEIENDEPVKAMQNCWKGLSPPTAEDDVVNKWHGCIYTSKRGPNLFIGKVTQRFLNDEGGLIAALEIDCLEQTGNCKPQIAF